MSSLSATQKILDLGSPAQRIGDFVRVGKL
jgi:hypothetical protein